MLPRNNKEYGTKAYWEDRFVNEESFEWLLSYQQLRHQLEPILLQYCNTTSSDTDDDVDDVRTDKSQVRILIVGCGNAPFSFDLYNDGYTNLINIDYSSVVIQNMEQKYPHMQWRTMDMTQMDAFHDSSFDVVIDKAAMDAIMTNEHDVWNPNREVVQNVYQMCHHISRLLSENRGTFVQISLSQPHFRSKYLLHTHSDDLSASQVDSDTDIHSLTNSSSDSPTNNYCPQFGWTVHAEAAGQSSDHDVAAAAFGHFLYSMKKEKNCSSK